VQGVETKRYAFPEGDGTRQEKRVLMHKENRMTERKGAFKKKIVQTAGPVEGETGRLKVY